MKYVQLHGLKTVCVLVCVLMYVCGFMRMCLRIVGEGLKLKGTSRNKDMESCSLESITYSAFSSNLKMKLAFHFFRI